jgi:hypothetical protein
MSLSMGCFLNSRPISSAGTLKFINLASTGLERCWIIKYSVYETQPVPIYILTNNFFLLFLYNIGLYSNIDWCYNDTLPCTTSRLPIYFQCLWYFLQLCALWCQQPLVYFFFNSLRAILIGQWASCSPDYKMWNHSLNIHPWIYWHQSIWKVVIFSSPAE